MKYIWVFCFFVKSFLKTEKGKCVQNSPRWPIKGSWQLPRKSRFTAVIAGRKNEARVGGEGVVL
jgi:hypothetical protein